MTGTKQHYVIKPGFRLVPVPNASTIQRLEASVIESKPASEFVRHQVLVFEHTKTIERRDNRVKVFGKALQRIVCL